MLRCGRIGGTLLIAAGLLGWVASPAEAAVHVEGQVEAGGDAVAGAMVSLWAASGERAGAAGAGRRPTLTDASSFRLT